MAESLGTWVSNIQVKYQIKEWADGYLWEAPQLNQVGIVKYSCPNNCDTVFCQWWDNQVLAGSNPGKIIRNAQGMPVQINWNNGVIFRRQ